MTAGSETLLSSRGGEPQVRCAELSEARQESMTGTAPRADVWVAVEHQPGWGDAELTRSGHDVRVLMARAPRSVAGPPDADERRRGELPGTRVWVGYVTDEPMLRVGTVAHPADVATWDLAAVAAGSMRAWGAPDPDPLLLVCANGRRDRCCGHLGGRLADALWRGPHARRVLTSTHLGGHRFAPTALLLPVGALHGRLDPDSAADLLSGASAGTMRADTLRGFSALTEPAQVAEAHARVETGYLGLDPLPVELPGPTDPAGGSDGRSSVRARVLPSAAAQAGAGAIGVDLVRRTDPTLLACGRQLESRARWLVG